MVVCLYPLPSSHSTTEAACRALWWPRASKLLAESVVIKNAEQPRRCSRESDTASTLLLCKRRSFAGRSFFVLVRQELLLRPNGSCVAACVVYEIKQCFVSSAGVHPADFWCARGDRFAYGERTIPLASLHKLLLSTNNERSSREDGLL